VDGQLQSRRQEDYLTLLEHSWRILFTCLRIRRRHPYGNLARYTEYTSIAYNPKSSSFALHIKCRSLQLTAYFKREWRFDDSKNLLHANIRVNTSAYPFIKITDNFEWVNWWGRHWSKDFMEIGNHFNGQLLRWRVPSFWFTSAPITHSKILLSFSFYHPAWQFSL